MADSLPLTSPSHGAVSRVPRLETSNFSAPLEATSSSREKRPTVNSNGSQQLEASLRCPILEMTDPQQDERLKAFEGITAQRTCFGICTFRKARARVVMPRPGGPQNLRRFGCASQTPATTVPRRVLRVVPWIACWVRFIVFYPARYRGNTWFGVILRVAKCSAWPLRVVMSPRIPFVAVTANAMFG